MLAEPKDRIAVGTVLTGSPKQMVRERLWAFSGGKLNIDNWPKHNIHTDIEIARKTGLSTLAVSGTQVQGHIVELLLDVFGEEWLTEGTFTSKFFRPIDAEEVLTTRATVTQLEAGEDGRMKCSLKIETKNENGTLSVAGTAVGVLSA